MATDVVVLDHGEIGESVMKQQSKGHDECCKTGPGYVTPLDAMSAPKENLIYVSSQAMNCIILSGIHAALAMEILLRFDNILFYLHCCLHLCTRLLIPSPEDITRKTGLASSHCLASCDIMISLLGDGDKDGNAAGSGFLLDSEFNVKGRWEKPGHSRLFGYDFWYQPQHKTMISTSWGAPAVFTKGFNLQHVSDGFYGRHLHIYS
ncbi:selenium-binding protein 2-like [Trifolium pratense]|uniref:Selenium-binding protein 2-like n=1 Tax=Trifolium pratense TaxID=57577 RepID=A0A2K3PH10_TRIPR|nr:selenium-binding protein 2-like [Trifolium pratense]